MSKTDVLTKGAAWQETQPVPMIEAGDDVQWLWPGRIPVGKVTLIEGDEGVGKSFVALDIAARVSRGTAWPDGVPCPELWFPRAAGSGCTTAGETPAPQVPVVHPADDRQDPGEEKSPQVLMFIRPDEFKSHRRRLVGLGANLSKLCWWRDLDTAAGADDENPDGGGRLEFPRDLSVVEQQLAEHESIHVVVIDSLADFCRRPQDLADALRRLNQLAEKRGVAIIVTLPARTRFDGQRMLRTTSRCRTDGARNVWCVAADPDDPRRKLFIPRRVNFCEESPGLEFRLAAGRVAWNSASRIDPHDPLDYWKSLDKCLTGIFETHCVPANDVFRQGSQCGFTPKQMRSGARRLGIESHKSPGFGSDGCWVWYTPEQRQRFLDGMHEDGPANVGWALPTTSDEGPPRGYIPPVSLAAKLGLPSRSNLGGGGQSPPYGETEVKSEESGGQSVACQAGTASANAKNAESLEEYREIVHQVWNDMARDKPTSQPAADSTPAWKRPRKKVRTGR